MNLAKNLHLAGLAAKLVELIGMQNREILAKTVELAITFALD